MPSRFLNNININDEYSLPNADGSADQIITTDGAGQLSFVDQSTINAGNAEHVVIYAKNTSGASIAKGTPVYITGTVGATDTVEIAPADAGNAAKMPSVGLLDDTLINNAFGYVITGGFMDNITTDPIDGATPSSNDTVYVKVGGGLTLTKPTGPTGLIQNVAKVGKVSGGNSGSLIVSSILRSNDVPNLTTGKIWVGDGNTVESTVVHLDEVNERMGINTASPLQTLQVNGGVLSTLGLYSDFALASNRNWSIETNTFGAGNWGGIAIKTSTSNGGDPSTARFGIDSSGNVGIGTTSPGYKLDVNGDVNVPFGASTGYRINGNRTLSQVPGAFELGVLDYKTTYPNISFNNDNTFRVQQNGSTKMIINSSGNVGIGTTSPGAKLDVNGEIKSDKTANGVSFSSTGGGSSFTAFDVFTATNGGLLRLYNESTQTVNIDGRSSGGNSYFNNGGNVGIGTTNPSAKLEVNGDIMLRNPNGANPTDAGSFIFNESGTTWGTDIYGFRFNLNGSSNVLTLQGANTTTVNDIISFTRDSASVGIGTDSPSQKLHVSGNARVTGAYYDSNNLPGTSGQVLSSTATGTDWVSLSEISGVDGTGTTNYVAKWSDTDTITDSVIYDNGTNVGIGTTSPSYKLSIAGPSSAQLEIINSSNSKSWRPNVNGDDFYITETGVSNPFVIQAGGNVGIGTTSPQAKLHVFGTTSSLPALGAPASAAQIGGSSYGTLFSTLTSGVGVIQQGRNDGTAASYSLSLQPSGGNVGIGTTSPSAPLSLGNGGAESLELNHNISSSSRILSYNRSNNTYRQLQLDALEHIFKTSSSEKMRITSGGNVGIGTTSPSSPLNIRSTGNRQIHLSDTSDSTTQGLFLGYDSAGNVLSYIGSSYNSDGSRIDFRMKGLAEGDSKMSILGSGNVGIGTTSPNSRLEVNGEIDANGGDGYKIDGRPWANWGSDLLTLGDWDGEGYATRIMGSNSSEVMRVTGTNVGIGTISPLNKLQVTGGSIGVDSEYIIRDNRNNTILLQSSNTVASNRSLTIGNATYSNITTASNVGIGTSAPSQKLDVTGNALISGTLYINNTSSSIYRFFNELIIQNTASTSISIGGGPGNVTNNLEVNGFVEATASTDAYKGYIKQSVICIATEKQDSTDYFFIPYNTSATSASAQYYNRMVAAYDGRVKKVYIKNTSGTPSADTVNLKKHVNNTTDATEYSATVANAASAGMSAVYNFANNDFTFSEGDNFGVLYQTVNSGGGGRSMAGVTINIIVEYNIT